MICLLVSVRSSSDSNQVPSTFLWFHSAPLCLTCPMVDGLFSRKSFGSAHSTRCHSLREAGESLVKIVSSAKCACLQCIIANDEWRRNCDCKTSSRLMYARTHVLASE